MNRAIFSFIWSGKTELVRRSVLVQSPDDGGLSVTDIRRKCDAFYVRGMGALWGDDGPPRRHFALYWVALSLRRVLPSWSNTTPHSLRPTAYYGYFCKLALQIFSILPDFDWGTVTVRQLYELFLVQQPIQRPTINVQVIVQVIFK